MSNIIFCENHKCPLKEKCVRYNPDRKPGQRYAVFHFKRIRNRTACDHFIPKTKTKE